MTSQARIESECLLLLGRLFGALGDDEAFVRSRTACERWQFRRRKTDGELASFLCQQLRRAAEARQVSQELSGGRPDASAVVMLGDDGRVIAASASAWGLLHETPGQPLVLPSRLAAHLTPILSSGLAFPRALRVTLDDRSAEVAGVLLGVDEMPGPSPKPRHVATLLMWNPALDAATMPRSAYLKLASGD